MWPRGEAVHGIARDRKWGGVGGGEEVAIVGWAIFMAVIRVSKNRYSNTHSEKVSLNETNDK